MGVLRGLLGAREVAVDEEKPRAVALGEELVLDRGRTGRHVGTSLPAPRVDEPARRVAFEHLADRDVRRYDLDAVGAACPELEDGVHALPADDLLRVDEELPDGLGTRVDHELAPDGKPLSRAFHAFSSLLVLLQA